MGPKPTLDYFKYDHLPEALQAISKPFCDLATQVSERGGDYRQVERAINKLLEAKDCAVRAAL